MRGFPPFYLHFLPLLSKIRGRTFNCFATLISFFLSFFPSSWDTVCLRWSEMWIWYRSESDLTVVKQLKQLQIKPRKKKNSEVQSREMMTYMKCCAIVTAAKIRVYWCNIQFSISNLNFVFFHFLSSISEFDDFYCRTACAIWVFTHVMWDILCLDLPL